jgi:hypothetical protein
MGLNGAWETRREKAVSHASGFSWAENARQTARIYEHLISQVQ